MFKLTKLSLLARSFHKQIVLLAVMTATVLSSVASLEVMTKAVSINDGGEVSTVYTMSEDADAILAEAGITLGEDDEYAFSGISDGEGEIRLMRAFKVTVTADGKTYSLSTTGGTVADALKKAGVTVGENDSVSVATDTKLTEGMNIIVGRIEYKTEVKEVAIPFETKTVYSDKLASGAVKQTKGSDGVKAVTYSYKFINGQIANAEIVDETVTKEAVASVKTVGTKQAEKKNAATAAPGTDYGSLGNVVSSLTPDIDIALDANGVPTNYTKKITGKASAYTWTGHHTCTGKVPQTGYIAVNTKIIPLHTKLFIRCADGSYIYGYAVAEDTGGFAKTTDRVVDLYFNTRAECYQFGVRYVDIYVLG